MKKSTIVFIYFFITINIFAQVSYDSEKKLPPVEGITIKNDGTIISKEDRIITFDSYSGFDALAKTYGLKLQYFSYENTKYVLFNEGDYRYCLIKQYDWKTYLYKNNSNVNIIPIYGKLIYDELYERKLDFLISEFKKEKNYKSNLVLFTYYDLDNKKVKFISSIFFDDYKYYNSFSDEYEYPTEIPNNYYFNISDKEFIDFFNSTIENDTSTAITNYDYNSFCLTENYDRYSDNTWFNSSEQYKIFTKDNLSFDFYLGKLSSGTKTLRMTLKTMGCDEYYDCIESIVFINQNNSRISFDIPYDNTKYSYRHASFDILLKMNDKDYINVQKLKEVLSGEKVEIMLSFSNSYRKTYFVNQAKVNELLFMLDEFEKMEYKK